MAEVTDFLDQVISQDYASAAPTFKDIMGDVMSRSLEQEKVKVAGQIFNGVDAEDRADNDQYELDLDDDGEPTEYEMDDDNDSEEELDAAAEEALDMDDDDEEV
ncbi:hypothetical protein N8864_04295 [Gammaproteobacteria bacterium]|nr:hypothetical protein [Gammaproteobacteria bacterium]